MSNLSPEEQQRFLEWYDANVRTREDAIKANQALQQLEQQAAQKQAEDKQSEAQNTQALTSIGGAIASPLLYSAGTKAAGLLGLGGASSAGAATGAAGLAGAGATGATTAGALTTAATAPTAIGATGAAAGGGAGAAGGGLFSLAGAVPLAGVGAGLALGAKGAKDLLDGKTTKGWEGWGGRAQLGIATGGLSEIARLGGFGRKTTKDYQNERWGALSPELQGLKAANHDGGDGTWKDGKYAGEQWSFDKAQDLAKDDASHFIGVLGNAQTFGNDWLTTSEDKQREVVSQLVDQGLYHSNKGDVLISDDNQQKAKDIYSQIIGAS